MSLRSKLMPPEMKYCLLVRASIELKLWGLNPRGIERRSILRLMSPTLANRNYDSPMCPIRKWGDSSIFGFGASYWGYWGYYFLTGFSITAALSEQPIWPLILNYQKGKTLCNVIFSYHQSINHQNLKYCASCILIVGLSKASLVLLLTWKCNSFVLKLNTASWVSPVKWEAATTLAIHSPLICPYCPFNKSFMQPSPLSSWIAITTTSSIWLWAEV